MYTPPIPALLLSRIITSLVLISVGGVPMMLSYDLQLFFSSLTSTSLVQYLSSVALIPSSRCLSITSVSCISDVLLTNPGYLILLVYLLFDVQVGCSMFFSCLSIVFSLLASVFSCFLLLLSSLVCPVCLLSYSLLWFSSS